MHQCSCLGDCLQADGQASSSASGSGTDSDSESDSDSDVDSQPAAAEQDPQATRSDGDEQVQGQEAASGVYCLDCVHVQASLHTCYVVS